MKILDELYKIIKKRIKEIPANSSVATLVKKGEDRVIQKVGEEAVEVLVAAKGTSKKRIIEEMSDLYFMTIVLLAVKNITLDEVFAELTKRRKKRIKNSS